MKYRLEHVDARISKGFWLREISFEIKRGQSWAVVGPNGSGKSALGRLLAGKIGISSGTITGAPQHAEVLSFETHLATIEREIRDDESDLLDHMDPGRSTLTFLLECGGTEERAHQMAQWLDLTDLLPQGLRSLSTGEIRKCLLIRALMGRPELLILDDPFCGLDKTSTTSLFQGINGLQREGTVPILLLGKHAQLPAFVTHVAEMKDGRLLFSGDKMSWERQKKGEKSSSPLCISETCFLPNRALSPTPPDTPLVQFQGVHVAYNQKPVLRNLSFEVMPGENWMITGPNGSGKSTILSMINADNPKVYGQDVHLFGRKRGTGESIWEIKQQIGYLSAEFQIAYRASATPFSAILSGLSDSIGTYRRFSAREKEAAHGWLDALGMRPLKERPLRSLSAGQQRMVLMARAMIKAPRLLILDEPCQGLDDANTKIVLRLADALGASGKTSLLFVTHDPAEKLNCLTHHMQLTPSALKGSQAHITAL
ncbi:MAG: ATP-binding cassette domain-containing protein [Desulfobacterales bacterium]|nr:ATP-binding cassette domain-containing protein [Desulfobacterales bacterium]